MHDPLGPHPEPTCTCESPTPPPGRCTNCWLPAVTPIAGLEQKRLERELALDRARNARRALAAVDPGPHPYRAPGVPQEPPSDVGHWTNE